MTRSPFAPPLDPLALSAGVASRLVLAGVLLALLWGAVAWAMAL
jgi:hypothetical protein